jgi:glutamate synthase (NADPH/NADH) small chain
MKTELKIKPTRKPGRVKMSEQEAHLRIGNFKEVNLGLTAVQAVQEAQRCLQCKSRPCVAGCPVRVRIPDFIAALADGDIVTAARILLADKTLPAICGRVCPQEEQCETECVLGIKGEPVAIGYLERFVADWAMENSTCLGEIALPEASGKKVAVVGSGPAGLTVSSELARKGHAVTLFEALHATGGVLRYGIPEFRLPKAIVDTEVARLRQLGVEIECNVVVGKTLTLEALREEFDGVFIGNGAGLPIMLNIPGENLKGVYSANEYLTRVNLMSAWRDDCATPILRGRRVIVIGGGNTAMDAVRTSRRLGAERSVLLYRRSEQEMPARLEEIEHAREEGVEFRMLTAPLRILGKAQGQVCDRNDSGWVAGIRCQRMALGEPDDSGRRRPVPIEGEVFDIPADVVVNAVGTGANPLLTATASDLDLNRWGNIEIDDKGETSISGVFAGGDIVRGGATVILAMGDGKRAAAAIDDFLLEGKV